MINTPNAQEWDVLGVEIAGEVTDANNLPTGLSIRRMDTQTPETYHTPEPYGIIVSFLAPGGVLTGFQLFGTSTKLYVRCKWDTWTEWRQVSTVQ